MLSIFIGIHLFSSLASVAVVKSRDLHWGLLATKDHKEVSLSSLRLLLVADGANPWSLSSCDQFLGVFQPKGLRPDAICPCASSSEVLTVSVRRLVTFLLTNIIYLTKIFCIEFYVYY